jgi:predicted TIM-barrel fold metal-dependent hydrolase
VLPTRNIPAAVAELTRGIEQLGFVGAELPTNSEAVRYPGDPHFYPIYEAAQSLGVPIFIHPHARGQIRYVRRESFDNFFYGHMIALPFDQMIAAMHVVTAGVLKRFPRPPALLLEGVPEAQCYVARVLASVRDEGGSRVRHALTCASRMGVGF